MELKEYVDDVETICSTCEVCESACVGHMLKECFKSEIEIEEESQFSSLQC